MVASSSSALAATFSKPFFGFDTAVSGSGNVSLNG
jgi:hypothetical protein